MRHRVLFFTYQLKPIDLKIEQSYAIIVIVYGISVLIIKIFLAIMCKFALAIELAD